MKESLISARWRIVKTEEVKIGEDGYVRQVLIAYKDTTVDQPTNQLDTQNCKEMDDKKIVHENTRKLLMQEGISFVKEEIRKNTMSAQKEVLNEEVD